MGYDGSCQDNLHEVAGVAYRLFARPEEIEDGVQKQQADDHEQHADQYVQEDDIAQRVLGCRPVSLAQPDGYDGRRSDSHHRTERRGYVHQRQGDSESRDSQCSDTVTDEDAVDDVVER